MSGTEKTSTKSTNTSPRSSFGESFKKISSVGNIFNKMISPRSLSVSPRSADSTPRAGSINSGKDETSILSVGKLSSEEKALTELLLELNQDHLFQEWDEKGINDNKKRLFFKQIALLNNSYPGGLRSYITKARKLLEMSKSGSNPLEGWEPFVPEGVSLDPLSSDYIRYEDMGKTVLGNTGFVLVAGGLGERLGYSGIKVSLPVETTTQTCYLELYCQQILAFQTRYAKGIKIPLAIMVSDDTKDKTVALLESKNYFGLLSEQVTILKQEKVAALSSTDGKIALLSTYEVDSKPHGHGDVHALMFSSGTAARWLQQGIKYVAFFQDTNGLCFATLAAVLGVSESLGLEVNSMTVPRKAKQAVGAITKLVKTKGGITSTGDSTNSEGTSITVNVEYNQLDPLLRATGHSEGDVNDPVTGLSPYPGNINQLVFKLEPYVHVLTRTSGLMGEFVNPKYVDATKTTFKKPTRLECMMQDYPKALSADAKVGFTLAPSWFCYSPCKNNSVDAAESVKSGVPAGSAFTAESDQYFASSEVLRLLGVQVKSSDPVVFSNITAVPGPRIVLHPSFAVLPSEVSARFPTPSLVSISANSTLVVEGDVVIYSLALDGALFLKAPPGSRLIVRAAGNPVVNKGHVLAPFTESTPEVDAMRGYKIQVIEETVITTESLLTQARETTATAAALTSSFLAEGLIEFVYNGKQVVAASAYESESNTKESWKCFC